MRVIGGCSSCWVIAFVPCHLKDLVYHSVVLKVSKNQQISHCILHSALQWDNPLSA